ncbi:PP2C family protein-serine/threonine phosphatase [Streptomyces galbus]|uniref:Serine/threonine-protein phosphatase n=1 Tax=Streptomyces galbus TaxID=33898 RepID=A0A4U5X6F5_STRGB|nr:PP2C family protein-serine/threonine phosphatase [Streptomyces galbus]TKT09026.1 serine/threonine-protein phosphatase [Streptomyces galbus]GHD25954.1 hypothetical protein GCM10010335_11820 [Streptomyces galbus]
MRPGGAPRRTGGRRRRAPPSVSPSRDGGLDVTLVRAGHTFPLHLADGRAARTVDCEGSLLGITPDPRVETHRLRLRPAESLVLYTDGLTEVRDPDGEQFGEERLARALSARHDGQPQRIIDRLVEAVHAFARDTGIDDDQAALVVTATAPGGPERAAAVSGR